MVIYWIWLPDHRVAILIGCGFQKTCTYFRSTLSGNSILLPPLSPHTFTKGWQIRTNWRSLHKYQMGQSASSGSQYTSFVNTLYNPWNFSAPSKKEGYTHQRQQIATPWGSQYCLTSIGDTMLWRQRKMWSWISLVDAPLDTSAYTWTCTCTQIHSYHTHRAGHKH